jgi:hypothetical protein
MSTAAQIEANRANAQLSTGPKTEAGKAASSSNALSTGLTSTKLYVRPEDQGHFNELKAGLMTSFQPSGTYENHLFDLILHAAWNVTRCITLQAELQNEANLNAGIDNLLDLLDDKERTRKFDCLLRYQKMHEANQRRAVNELRRVQTEAHRRIETLECLTGGVSELVNTAAVSKETSSKRNIKPAGLKQLKERFGDLSPRAEIERQIASFLNEPKSLPEIAAIAPPPAAEVAIAA